jgi:hypothetical protein
MADAATHEPAEYEVSRTGRESETHTKSEGAKAYTIYLLNL